MHMYTRSSVAKMHKIFIYQKKANIFLLFIKTTESLQSNVKSIYKCTSNNRVKKTKNNIRIVDGSFDFKNGKKNCWNDCLIEMKVNQLHSAILFSIVWIQ